MSRGVTFRPSLLKVYTYTRALAASRRRIGLLLTFPSLFRVSTLRGRRLVGPTWTDPFRPPKPSPLPFR